MYVKSIAYIRINSDRLWASMVIFSTTLRGCCSTRACSFGGLQLVWVENFYCNIKTELVKSRLLQQLSSNGTIFKLMLKLLRLYAAEVNWK